MEILRKLQETGAGNCDIVGENPSKGGRPMEPTILVVDDEDRENEGDFIIAAEKITPEKVNFMLTNGRGVLCAPITEEISGAKTQNPVTDCLTGLWARRILQAYSKQCKKT